MGAAFLKIEGHRIDLIIPVMFTSLVGLVWLLKIYPKASKTCSYLDLELEPPKIFEQALLCDQAFLCLTVSNQDFGFGLFWPSNFILGPLVSGLYFYSWQRLEPGFKRDKRRTFEL